MRDLYIEQAVKLQVKVLAVDVAVGELGDDGLQRVVELAPALEVLRCSGLHFVSLNISEVTTASSPSPLWRRTAGNDLYTIDASTPRFRTPCACSRCLLSVYGHVLTQRRPDAQFQARLPSESSLSFRPDCHQTARSVSGRLSSDSSRAPFRSRTLQAVQTDKQRTEV